MKQPFALELLEHLLVCGSSMIIHSLFVPYGHGLGRSVRGIERLAEKCPHDLSYRSRETTSVALSRLKLKGFVTSTGPKNRTIWKIAPLGKQHFKASRKTRIRALPPKDGKTRIVTFDVPEHERHKRDWLRRRLSACEYVPLQKSVWVGGRPLPQELLQELKELRISRYVHVFGLEEKL